MKRFFSFFLLSAKRSLRRPAFLLSRLLALGAVFLFTLRGSGESLPAAGIFDEDGSALSEEIVSSLKEKGFSVEKSREELRKLHLGPEMEKVEEYESEDDDTEDEHVPRGP